MDLHLGAAVAEAAAGLRRRRPAGRRGAGRRAGSASRSRSPRAAASNVSPAVVRTPVAAPSLHEDRVDLGVRPAGAAVVLDQPHERVGEPGAAALRHRHPALLDRDRDHLGHEAGGGGVGPEAGVEHPGREQAVRALGGERVLRASRGSRRARCRRTRRGRGVRAGGPPSRRAPLPLPTRAPCRAVRTRGRRSAGSRRAAPRQAAPSPGAWRSSSAAFASAVRSRKAASPSGKSGAGRKLGVQVLEPARGEVVAEERVRGAADPERVPGREDVVVEAGLGDLGRLDRAAEPVVPLEHADAPAARGRAARRTRAS